MLIQDVKPGMKVRLNKPPQVEGPPYWIKDLDALNGGLFTVSKAACPGTNYVVLEDTTVFVSCVWLTPAVFDTAVRSGPAAYEPRKFWCESCSRLATGTGPYCAECAEINSKKSIPTATSLVKAVGFCEGCVTELFAIDMKPVGLLWRKMEGVYDGLWCKKCWSEHDETPVVHKVIEDDLAYFRRKIAATYERPLHKARYQRQLMLLEAARDVAKFDPTKVTEDVCFPVGTDFLSEQRERNRTRSLDREASINRALKTSAMLDGYLNSKGLKPKKGRIHWKRVILAIASAAATTAGILHFVW